MSDDETFNDEIAGQLYELAGKFLEQFRIGECPSIEEFARQHAEFSRQILHLFPAILALEELKTEGARSEDGCVSLCGETLTKLGDFRIVREIGRGGMGIVFEAEQISLGRPVAIKVLPRTALSERAVDRFRQEAQTASRLHHSNIAPVYWYGSHEGYHYYAMQRIDGRSLDQVIRDGHPCLPAADASRHDRCRWVAELGFQAAMALEYAHRDSILHRDIKPANLLLDRTGRIWLMDFGLACAFRQGDPTRPLYSGTERYSAPEQKQGQCDGRSDVYSLGLTLETLLETVLEIDEGPHHAQGPSRLRKSGARMRIPRDLQAVIGKATARDPANRYQTAGEFAADLRRFDERRVVHARRQSVAIQLRRWAQRKPGLATSFVLLGMLLCGGALLFSMSYSRIGELNQRLSQSNDDLLQSNERLTDRADQLASAFFAVDALLRCSAPESPPAEFGEDTATAGLKQLVTGAARDPLLRLIPNYHTIKLSLLKDSEVLFKAIDARQVVSETMLSFADLERARTGFEYTLASIDRAEKTTLLDPNLLKLRKAAVLNHLANVHEHQADFHGASECHQQALLALEQIDAGFVSSLKNIEEAKALFGLATHSRRIDPNYFLPLYAGELFPMDSFVEAVPGQSSRYIDRAIILMSRTLASGDVSINRITLLARCQLKRAREKAALGLDCEEDRTSALQMLRSLYEQYPGTRRIRYAYAEALAYTPTLGSGAAKPGRKAISTRLDEACEIAERLVQEYPERPGFVGLLAWIHFKQATHAIVYGPIGDAESDLRETIRLQDQIAEKFPHLRSQRARNAVYHAAYALLLARLKRRDEARQFSLRAQDLLDSLTAQSNIGQPIERAMLLVQSLSDHLNTTVGTPSEDEASHDDLSDRTSSSGAAEP